MVFLDFQKTDTSCKISGIGKRMVLLHLLPFNSFNKRDALNLCCRQCRLFNQKHELLQESYRRKLLPFFLFTLKTSDRAYERTS